MKYRIPIKDLHQYSIKFSVVILLTSLLSTFLMGGDLKYVLFRAFTSAFHFYGCLLINIGWYVRLSHRMSPFDEKLKFLFGVLTSIVFMYTTTLISMWFITSSFFDNSFYDPKLMEMTTTWKVFVFVPIGAGITYTIAHFFHKVIILNYATKQSALEVLRLRSINMETTNRLLKQQIQPHFLFNALNILKSLINKQPSVAEKYLIQLSDFLRTSLTMHKVDMITLKDELQLCENYMEMQKIRFGDALIYNIDIPYDYLNKYSVPFFSIQPLLENAIKHNELTTQHPLKINVAIQGDKIAIHNNLRLKKNIETSTNNGLSNLQERYQILQGEEIEIEQTENEFIVRLKLIPNENSSH